MLSVVFVTTEPVIDVLIDSPWRNKPIEARFASPRKCSTRKHRAKDSNTIRRFHKQFQELILKILRLCNERMFKNIKCKSAASLFIAIMKCVLDGATEKSRVRRVQKSNLV